MKAVAEGRSRASSGPDCVGTGLIALDVIFAPDSARAPVTMAGGSCGNVMAILSYLGWRTHPIARLGKDSTSARILQDLSACGVDTKGIARDPVAESPIIIERLYKSPSGVDGHRFEWRCPVCGSWFPRFRPPTQHATQEGQKALENASVFYFDRPSRAAIELASKARARNALVFFEPSTTSHKGLFKQACGMANVVKYSHERLGGVPELENVSSEALVIETLGGAGLRYSLPRRGSGSRRWTELPALPASNFRDAAGAGDWCSSGFINRVLSNRRGSLLLKSDAWVRPALQFGQALAAINCSYIGARGAMYALTADQMRARASSVAGKGELRHLTADTSSSPLNRDVRKFCPTCVRAR
jgi:fructokinase